MRAFHIIRQATAAGLLVLGVAACMDTSDTTASVSPHKATPADSALAQVPSKSIKVSSFTMQRGVGVLPGRIGERTTIGNVSMGYVTLNPPPEVLFTNAIKTELSAAGHRVSGGGSSVSGVVTRFELSTPATLTYWDVTIDAALQVNVNGVRRSYTDRCVTRTTVWPSDKLISQVANDCVGKIAAKFRNDRSVANAI